MVKMLVIVPSRNRPQNIQRLIDSIQATSGTTPPVLLIVVDDDDELFDDYLEIYHNAPDWVELDVVPRKRLAQTWNDIAVQYADDYDILGFYGDDNVFKTSGWRREIENAMQPGGIVYGNDLIHGRNLPTAVFMDSRIVRKLGRVTAPGVIHLYMDNVWQQWGEKTGKLVYLDHVVIEHLHPIAGKAKMDSVYEEANSDEMYSHDGDRFNEYVSSGELTADIQRLKTIT